MLVAPSRRIATVLLFDLKNFFFDLAQFFKLRHYPSVAKVHVLFFVLSHGLRNGKRPQKVCEGLANFELLSPKQ